MNEKASFNREVAGLMDQNESYYTLVMAVAKRAREIADEAEYSHTIIVEKPVRLAVDDLYTGKTTIKYNRT